MTHKRLSVERSIIWLTPPSILNALGGWQSFDLDPCAAPEPRPWPTARIMNARADHDGLAMRWSGRVFLNPPYSVAQIRRWLRRMAEHNHGSAMIPASTGSRAWRESVWPVASGIMFLFGRIEFANRSGEIDGSGGAPSVICAYGPDDLERLAASGLDGELVPLRFARFVLVDALDETWRDAVVALLRSNRGPISVADAYRHFARHPKTRRNPNWQAKIRQQLREVGERVGRATYQARAA